MDALILAAVVAAGCAVLLWRIPGECRCEKCPFHTNERNMARIAQREAVHDVMHRGPKAPGFPAPTKDRWPCNDPECERNPVKR